jgi:pyruvate carboxylase
MPGGQYTNLLFQSQQLGLSGQWSAIKKAYARSAAAGALCTSTIIDIAST